MYHSNSGKNEHNPHTANQVATLIPDAPYSELNFNTTVSLNELNSLRENLIRNMSFLNNQRQRFRFAEYTQLVNHHQYALNTLNNMISIKHVERKNPFKQGIGDFSGQPLVYNEKGVLERMRPRENEEEWESQFSQGLINAPCGSLPSINYFGGIRHEPTR